MPSDLNDYFKKKNSGNNNNRKANMPNIEPPQFLKNFNPMWIIILILIITLGVIAKPFTIINSGEVGILVTTGKYGEKPLTPGLHFFIPFFQKVIIVDTKVHLINYKEKQEAGTMNDKYGSIKVYSPINVLDAKGLPILIELTVSYKLAPVTAPYTIQTYGLTWEDKIINPLVRDIVRNVIGRFPGEELPIKRNQIATLVEQKVEDKLSKLEKQPVILESVQLREIVLPVRIQEQIQDVQVAKQQSERVKNEVLKAQQEAEKRYEIASGIAKAKIIQAEGDANATIIRAKAEAEANEFIAKSLSKTLLELRQIEIQGKFNEALAVNKDAKIFLIPGGSTPNIWVDTKNKEKMSSQ